MLIGYLLYLLWRNIYSSYMPFKYLGVLSFFLVLKKSSLYVLYIKPLSDEWFTNHYPFSVNHFFTFLIISFEAHFSILLIPIYLLLLSLCFIFYYKHVIYIYAHTFNKNKVSFLTRTNLYLFCKHYVLNIITISMKKL